MNDLVTLYFRPPDGQVFEVQFPWKKGKKLRDYLRDPVIRKYGLIQRACNEKIRNQKMKKMKLREVLNAGDELTFGR